MLACLPATACPAYRGYSTFPFPCSSFGPAQKPPSRILRNLSIHTTTTPHHTTTNPVQSKPPQPYTNTTTTTTPNRNHNHNYASNHPTDDPPNRCNTPRIHLCTTIPLLSHPNPTRHFFARVRHPSSDRQHRSARVLNPPSPGHSSTSPPPTLAADQLWPSHTLTRLCSTHTHRHTPSAPAATAPRLRLILPRSALRPLPGAVPELKPRLASYESAKRRQWITYGLVAQSRFSQCPRHCLVPPRTPHFPKSLCHCILAPHLCH